MTGPTAQGRRPGRPRDARADAVIRRATLELLLEAGYRGLAMEAVAARAGVGKTTVYRRFPTKRALVAAQLAGLQEGLELPDTGSALTDYFALATQVLEQEADVDIARLVPRLLVEASDDPGLLELVTTHLVAPRRELLKALLRRGAARGELRADLDLEDAADMLVGPFVYRMLLAGGAPEAAGDLPATTAQTLFPAWAPVEPAGIEPATSCLQSRRSPS